MVSTSSSSPIHGLRPRIRGRSVVSTEAGLTFIFAGGGVGTPRGGGGLAQVGLRGGEGVHTGFPVTCFWEEGHKVQMVSMHHQHAKNRRPWILLHVVSGPWTSFLAVSSLTHSFVAALDKGQCNIAVCRGHNSSKSFKGLVASCHSFCLFYLFLTLHGC